METIKTKINDKYVKSSFIREPLRDIHETAIIFGYKGEKGLRSSMNRGTFPQPDSRITKMNGTMKYYWKLSTISKEKKRRASLIKQGELK
jgi:hypothetical protein